MVRRLVSASSTPPTTSRRSVVDKRWARSKGLWIPEEAKEKKRACMVCGRRFPYDQFQQWKGHVIKCEKTNPEYVEGMLAAHESDDIVAVADKEKYAWKRSRGDTSWE
jgi:transcriptional regulator NrdR family protein